MMIPSRKLDLPAARAPDAARLAAADLVLVFLFPAAVFLLPLLLLLGAAFFPDGREDAGRLPEAAFERVPAAFRLAAFCADEEGLEEAERFLV